jgi:hypothetical protein
MKLTQREQEKLMIVVADPHDGMESVFPFWRFLNCH